MEGPRHRETGRAWERQKETKAEKIRQTGSGKGLLGNKRRWTGEAHRERLMTCRSWAHSQGSQDVHGHQLESTGQFPGHQRALEVERRGEGGVTDKGKGEQSFFICACDWLNTCPWD